MELHNLTVTPSAIANGIDENIVKVQVMDGIAYAPGVSVVFEVSGSAFFYNKLNRIVVSTDSLGNTSTAFMNTVAEEVVVKVSLEQYPEIYQSLTTEFTQSSSNEVDNILLLVTVDEAKADGEDTNQVILQTMSGSTPVGLTKVSVALTHGAEFIDGSHTADITTNISGQAILPFTNVTSGDVKISAYLTSNLAVFATANATFTPAVPEGELSLSVITDNATANGKTYNSVMAFVTDPATGGPVRNASVTFYLSGSATFSNTAPATNVFSSLTNDNGQVIANFSDTIKEQVQVTAISGTETEKVTVNFTDVYAPLKISRVSNKNRDFTSEMPTVAWKGAVFYIEASGGMGNYDWSVIQGSDVLTVTDSHSNMATFHFNSDSALDAERVYVINLSDGNESVTYTFNVTRYFTKFGAWENFKSADRYPPISDLQQLYKEWGNMRNYDGWLKSDEINHYWTNSTGPASTAAVNLTNGRVDSIGWFAACGYAGS